MQMKVEEEDKADTSADAADDNPASVVTDVSGDEAAGVKIGEGGQEISPAL